MRIGELRALTQESVEKAKKEKREVLVGVDPYSILEDIEALCVEYSYNTPLVLRHIHHNLRQIVGRVPEDQTEEQEEEGK
jgi:phage terminase large subunit-like protein